MTAKKSRRDDGSPSKKAPNSLESRIRAGYDDLPESERRIADLILESPGEMAAYSATELAALSGSSKAAVTRLVQRIGFANYEAARRAARDAQNWGSPLYLMTRARRKTGFTERVRNHIEQDLRNIQATMEALEGETLGETVTAVCKAKRVFLLGYRNSHWLAAYAHRQIGQARGEVYLLPAMNGALAEEIADLASGDLLVAIGLRRRPARLQRAMAAAAASGAHILYIADRATPASPHATWTLPCAVSGAELFDRYAAAMSLLHFLCVAIVEKLGASARRRLRRIEALHEDLHDFG